MKKNILLSSFLLLSIILTGCRDMFGNLNDNSEKTPPRIEFLFTGSLEKMNSNDYLAWFWNNTNILTWLQLTASSSGNSDQLGYMSDVFEEFELLMNTKRQTEGIKTIRASKSPAEALIYKHIEAMCIPIDVFMGLLATDATGSVPYSEAGYAYFKGESAFLPKFDTQEELFNEWLSELKECIEILSQDVVDENGNIVSQFNIGAQDFVYKGDAKKWAKFANSLRLKIAVRLLHKNRSLAEQTVAEAMKYPLIETADDDFIWNPGSRWFNSGEDFRSGAGSKQLIEFMVKNKDPRVRFIFTKNQFNENVVNEFLKQGKKLPSFIAEQVEVKTNTDGSKSFASWKGAGEPWVRYHGVPIDIKATEYPENKFDYYTALNRQLGEGEKAKTYASWSSYNETMLKGRFKYVYPTIPDQDAIEYDRDEGITFNYLSAAEVNLYLAEFKVLGFNGLPKSAEEYYKNGIQYSVLMYDQVGKANKVPYYSKVIGLPDSDLPIALKDGEIDYLLQQNDYQLIGSKQEQLERIYVQMYIHFAMRPSDLFTTVRRTGVPIKNSSYLPAEVWNSITSTDLTIPRRLQVKSLSESDELYNQRKKAYEEEGFTPGKNDPTTLNKERIWFDQGAPDYGTGPNY